jgi:lipoate-protein ligase A
MTQANRSPLRGTLLIEGARTGAMQMAIDEVLLDDAAAYGKCWLRFYQWSEPTLSLGYFQPYADRSRHAESQRCPVVRRQTGGGAIVHDRELTYCLAMPLAHPLASDATRLYDAVHLALIEVLSAAGIAARLCGDETASAEGSPFLCFQRRSAQDVVSGPAKICGSAQRRRRGAILQHGSLLLAASAQAPELPGLAELQPIGERLGQMLEATQVARIWAKQIGARLLLELSAGQLPAALEASAAALAGAKYADSAWTRRR